MPYIQNSERDQQNMLKEVGVTSLEELFVSIPQKVRLQRNLDLPEGLSEAELLTELTKLSEENKAVHNRACFLGGGMYRHYFPTVIDHLQSRSEFVTCYTPYQAEASQGTLTAFFEFQTMIAQLCGLEIANASMYDGFSAVAEAIMMAVNTTGRKKVVLSRGLHPFAKRTSQAFFRQQDIQWVEAGLQEGVTDWASAIDEQTACVVIQNPNYLGAIENLKATAGLAHQHGALAIAFVHPIALAILESPGEAGIDIACGDGQPLGVGLQYGGPSFGFFAASKQFVRKMPGRIVGETKDQDGKRGFVLTFQTREQHIRREKATSNICTNNALFALRGAMYLAAAGPVGLRETAQQCVQKAHYAFAQIAALPGYQPIHQGAFFNEFAFTCPAGTARTQAALNKVNIAGGIALENDYAELKNALMFAVTETNSKQEIDHLVTTLRNLS